jgi:NADH-quinone oxidoreductase subunit F
MHWLLRQGSCNDDKQESLWESHRRKSEEDTEKMQILEKSGMKAYKKALEMRPEAVIRLLGEKGLLGRGGASFSAAKKWEMVRNSPGDEKYVICNADEGEPGTFKDRFIIENNPETLVEGILIAAYATGAKKAYIYLRGEYECLKPKLQKAVNSILRKSDSNVEIEIFLGAGAYICGEETAIISSIEGMRGQPRIRPPYPTDKGLFGKPTAINNVETLTNVPLAMTVDSWNDNIRLHCISGDVENPGIFELPMGVNLSEVINLAKPKEMPKAVYFGCFGGCLPYEGRECMELTPKNVCGEDCMLGSCSMIVVGESRSMVDMATNIAKFYEFESCGKCTPCREGSMRILSMLQTISLGKAKKEDIETLKELAEVIKETSLCGLGQTSTHHLLNALKFFRKEFEDRIKK